MVKLPDDLKDNESWPGWFGRRLADLTCLWLLYYFLKWLGIIVVITVQTP